MIMLIPYMQRASKLLILHQFISSTRLCNSFASQFSSKFHAFSNVDSLVSALITAISTCSSISYCRALHCRVIKSVNCNHGFIGDQLVSRYVELGCTKDSLELFDELPEKDLVSWNSIISGFSRRGDLGICLGLLLRMRLEMGFKPNEVTVIPVVSACAGVGELDVGKYIHGIAVKLGVLLEVKVVNSLINLYGKCGYLEAACCLFEGMPVQSLVSWNSMVAVHVHMGLAEKGIGYFIMMRRAGINSDQATVVSLLLACENLGVRKLAEAVHGYILNGGLDRNLAVATALLDLYAKLGILSDPRKVFGEMIDPDAVAWTAMLSSYAMHGRGREAIEHFELMNVLCQRLGLSLEELRSDTNSITSSSSSSSRR
ncbi:PENTATRICOPEPTIDE (PPR) REPEAT PROTEIN [Salix koriyanagi]|uniref:PENTATRICOPEPTIDE (PPR) REPEAT PROTEIN n=1 Tax=Salix koriyanagi TaxID=2511006 RepID=A0A9Q0QLQ8_9ROSI|nr:PENTATRICOPEPTIDE (PPR) REPEAT PROTEIN [Salix koriyanagi]